MYLKIIVFGFKGLLLLGNFSQVGQQHVILSDQPSVLSLIDLQLISWVQLAEFVGCGDEGLGRTDDGDWVQRLQNIFGWLLLGHL